MTTDRASFLDTVITSQVFSPTTDACRALGRLADQFEQRAQGVSQLLDVRSTSAGGFEVRGRLSKRTRKNWTHYVEYSIDRYGVTTQTTEYPIP